MNRIAPFAAGIFAAISLFFAGTARALPTDADATECKSMLLMDAASGEVLSEVNSHVPLPPASMVKIMLSYVALKKVKEGVVKLNDSVTVTATASKVGGSQVFLKQGEQFRLEQLLEAVLVQSANDAATAIAEHIGGTRDGFVEMMNAEAKALGMNESTFYTPHGLPPSKDQKPDLVSAHDFALLSRTLIKDYPEVLVYTSKVETPFRDGAFNMTNHNHLLRHYQGCDGLKTGFYSQAGFSITATAQRNGVRMISVVMGCRDRKKRDAEAARLLSQGISQFRSVSLIEKGAPVSDAGLVLVAGGQNPQVLPVAADHLKAFVKTGDESRVQRKVSLCSGLEAPVPANTPCGELTFHLGERELGKVPLVIPENVPTGSIFSRLRNRLGI